MVAQARAGIAGLVMPLVRGAKRAVQASRYDFYVGASILARTPRRSSQLEVEKPKEERGY